MVHNTRIAPSPTGYFHLGTARTAYFNYLVAKATGGKFVLRIDDTDLNRNDDAFYKTIFDTFDWLGLKYDQLVYQSKRLDFYASVADKLVQAGRAKKSDGAIVLVTPVMKNVWYDTIGGDMKITDDDMKRVDGLVLMKSDGMPTYNFASILDDVDMGITWVIRGVDHIKNTPKQLAILASLDGIMDVSDLKFTHVGLIHHNVDGKSVKMSKRDGAKSVTDYKADYDADVFLNHILKLGWGHPDPLFDKKFKIVSKSDAINLVLDGKFRNVSSTHDVKKLDSLKREWHKNAPVV